MTRTSDPTGNEPVYIMREPCGCVVWISADEANMRASNAKEIADGIRDGLTVERVNVQWVWDHGLQRCPEHAAQAQHRQATLEEAK